MGLQRVQHDLMTNTSKLLQATGLELDLENSGVNKTYATLQLSKSVDGVKHMSFWLLALLLLLLLSHFSRVRLCATPETAAHQDPLVDPSMGFSRQEHWSGVPLPSPLLALMSVIISSEQLNQARPPRWHVSPLDPSRSPGTATN